MKKVLVLTTGGTIASKRGADGLYTAGVLTGEELISMCQLPDQIEVIVESMFQVPSNQMTFDHLLCLKERIETHFENNKISGVVITHGTDTLEETAFFLDLTIRDQRPVVVTGAQLTPQEEGTDAFTNIRDAIIVASSPKCQDLGCVVVFSGDIFSSRYVKKIHAAHRKGFGVSGFGYFGVVDKGNVYIYQKPTKKEYYQLFSNLPQIDIIPCYLGSDDTYIRSAIGKGVKGLILDGIGRGHVPPQWVEAIREAVEKQIKVVIVTQASEGSVYPVYDFKGGVQELLNQGVILGGDYDSKKARMKLAVMLAASETFGESI